MNDDVNIKPWPLQTECWLILPIIQAIYTILKTVQFYTGERHWHASWNCFIFPFCSFPPLRSSCRTIITVCLCLLSEKVIKLARPCASAVHKDVLKDWLRGLMNKLLLPPYTSVHLSLFLSDGNWREVWKVTPSLSEVWWELVCQ